MSKETDLQARKAELLRELAGLQSAWKEIAQKLSLNVRARFHDLQAVLEDKDCDTPPTPKQLKAALAEIRECKIKPAKGRAKDLARIDGLLDSLFAIYPGRES
jgi:hypothetical protein